MPLNGRSRWAAITPVLVTLAVMFGGIANAQIEPPLSLGAVACTATAVPPVVRAEGIAELIGEIVLVCTNTPPAGNSGPLTRYLVTNINVFLNVNVTNNIGWTGAGEQITDSVLVVNENNCTSPSELGGGFGGCGAPDPEFQDPQFGTLADVNRIEWDQVSLPVPGAPRAGFDLTDDCSVATGTPANCFPTVTTLRIASIRSFAFQLGVPVPPAFSQIIAFVSITGPVTIPVTNNVLNVAVPILGHIAQVDEDAPIRGLQCIDNSLGVDTYVSLKEGFATGFKRLGEASFLTSNMQWESGYYATSQQGGTSNNGAGAVHPTRFLIRFFNIPAGVTIEVPRMIEHGDPMLTEDALQIALVAGADFNGAGGTAVTSGGNEEVSIFGGFGAVTYQIADSNPFQIEEWMAPITFTWQADPGNGFPALGSGQVSATLAPLSTVVVADANEPEPRFIDAGGDPTTILSIEACPGGAYGSVPTGQTDRLTTLERRRTPEQIAILKWYDAASNQFPVGDFPEAIAYDGANVWVTNLFDDNVTKLRASDGANLGSFPVGDTPGGVAFDGANVWVTNFDSDNVTKLRAGDGFNLGTFAVGDGPSAVAFDGANVWVTNLFGDSVTKLRASDGASLGTFMAGDGPRGLAFDGASMWVTNLISDNVTRLQVSDGANLGTFAVGDGPYGVAFDGANVWVANSNDNNVVRLRASDGANVGTFAVGLLPRGVAFDGAHIWVTNLGDDTVAKLRADNGSLLGTFAVGDGPQGGVVFDGANIWVTNGFDDTISKL